MGTEKSNEFKYRRGGTSLGATSLYAVMRDFSYEKHSHEELALGVTLAGRQEFTCKGRLFTSLPGNLMLFNPGDPHDGHPGDASPLRYVMLYIRPEALYPLIGCVSERPEAIPRFAETVFDDPALRARILTFSRMAAQANASQADQEMQLFGVVESLAARFGGARPPGKATPGAGDGLFARVREYVMDNLDRELSVDELSGAVHLSKYHFIRTFRDRYGVTPHRFALSCRVNRARAALEKGRPPSQAAQDFGFADLSHFNRRFKQAYGVTPRQYQSQYLR